MSRKTRHIISSIVIIGFLMIAGISAWLLGTAQGAAWLIQTIAHQAGAEIAFSRLEGRLWNTVRLEGIEATWEEGHAKADKLFFEWHPLMAVTGTIAVKKLSVSNVVIQDDRPEEDNPLDLSWPKVNGLPAKLDAWIDTLEIKELTYIRLKNTPFTVKNASSLILWHNGMISVRNLMLSTPDIEVTGTVEAGFLHPSLLTDITATPVQSLPDIERFSLKARLMPGQRDEQLHGPITISGLSGDEQMVTISFLSGITKTALNLSELRAEQANRKGMLNGKGVIDFSDVIPALTFSLSAAGIDLSPETGMATDIHGNLSLNGNIEDYRGDFSFSNKGPQVHQAEITGSIHGSMKDLHIQITGGAFLGGKLKGKIETSWREGITFTSELQARNMDPAILSPDWSGAVNLNLSAEMQKPEDGETAVTMRGRILESRLRGTSLTGELHADMRGENLIVRKFALKGKGFDINASGDLAKRLSFLAHISDLAGLIPDARGRLNAEGWVRKDRDGIALSLNARGGNIAIDQAQMNDVTFSTYLSEIAGAALHLKADINGLKYGDFQIRTASFKVQGKPETHEISISLNSPDLALQAGLRGAYRKSSWKGSILSLAYRDSIGRLNLASPAELSLSKDRFALSPFIVKGNNTESLSVKGELTKHPLDGFVQADWNLVNLARINQWLENTRIIGNASGTGHILWSKGTLKKIGFENTASGSLTARGQTVDIKGNRFSLAWNTQGLIASVSAQFSESGMFETKLTSSSPPVVGIPAQGKIDAGWKDFSLSMFNPFLPENIVLSGKTTGSTQSQWTKKSLSSLSGKVNAHATIVLDGHPVSLQEISLQLDMKGRKILSRLDIELTSGGSIHGQFISPMPPQLAMPEQGDISTNLENIDLALIQSWLPQGFSIQGSVAGQMKGNLFPGGKFTLSGRTFLSQGSFSRKTDKGTLSAGLQDTAVSWNWSGEVLKGDATITLTGHGKASAQLELPVPARLPLAINRSGAVRIAVNAAVQEKGMLSSIFPGLVQESQGVLELDSRIDGTWKEPQFKGTILLKDAGAYFPAAGISLKDILVKGRFEKDRLIIDTFSVKSGDGALEGTARISFRDWEVSQYEGEVRGKRFRTVHLPELQVTTSPQLRFEGSTEKISVNGEIKIPELFVYGSGASAPVKPSADVIFVDTITQEKKGPLLALDIRIHILLGDKVFVKAEGIDAQVKGDVVVAAKNPDEINGKGLIQVVKGDYRRYGVNLAMTRGRLIFNGLVTRPTLDVVALRTSGDVKAGVMVSGTPQVPEVKLYSEPPMPDTDILAYMVFGHPLGSNKEQSSAVLQAAGVLLSQGESVALQEKMRRSLGVDMLDIESGGGDLSRSMLTLGKYLTPRLFISYGQSFFDEGGLFRLRYSLSRRWEIETQSGEQTGGDLFYKIEFR